MSYPYRAYALPRVQTAASRLEQALDPKSRPPGCSIRSWKADRTRAAIEELQHALRDLGVKPPG
jgi:hypothetical protein